MQKDGNNRIDKENHVLVTPFDTAKPAVDIPLPFRGTYHTW